MRTSHIAPLVHSVIARRNGVSTNILGKKYFFPNMLEEHSPSGIPLIFFMFSKMQAVLTHAIWNRGGSSLYWFKAPELETFANVFAEFPRRQLRQKQSKCRAGKGKGPVSLGLANVNPRSSNHQVFSSSYAFRSSWNSSGLKADAYITHSTVGTFSDCTQKRRKH